MNAFRCLRKIPPRRLCKKTRRSAVSCGEGVMIIDDNTIEEDANISLSSCFMRNKNHLMGHKLQLLTNDKASLSKGIKIVLLVHLFSPYFDDNIVEIG